MRQQRDRLCRRPSGRRAGNVHRQFQIAVCCRLPPRTMPRGLVAHQGVKRGLFLESRWIRRGRLLDAIELEFDMPFAPRSQCRVELRQCLAETVHTRVPGTLWRGDSVRRAYGFSSRNVAP